MPNIFPDLKFLTAQVPYKISGRLSIAMSFPVAWRPALPYGLLCMPGILSSQQRSKFPFYNYNYNFVIKTKTPNCTYLPLWPFFYAQICLYAKPDNFGPFLINVLKEHVQMLFHRNNHSLVAKMQRDFLFFLLWTISFQQKFGGRMYDFFLSPNIFKKAKEQNVGEAACFWQIVKYKICDLKKSWLKNTHTQIIQ